MLERYQAANCLLQHHSVPLSKLLGVTLCGIREARDGTLAKEEAEHAADVTTADLQVTKQAAGWQNFAGKDAHAPKQSRTPGALCPFSRAASRMPRSQADSVVGMLL